MYANSLRIGPIEDGMLVSMLLESICEVTAVTLSGMPSKGEGEEAGLIRSSSSSANKVGEDDRDMVNEGQEEENKKKKKVKEEKTGSRKVVSSPYEPRSGHITRVTTNNFEFEKFGPPFQYVCPWKWHTR